jgi:hypothetical protein
LCNKTERRPEDSIDTSEVKDDSHKKSKKEKKDKKDKKSSKKKSKVRLFIYFNPDALLISTSIFCNDIRILEE